MSRTNARKNSQGLNKFSLGFKPLRSNKKRLSYTKMKKITRVKCSAAAGKKNYLNITSSRDLTMSGGGPCGTSWNSQKNYKKIHNSQNPLSAETDVAVFWCVARVRSGHFVAVGDEAGVEHVDGLLLGVAAVGGAGERWDEVARGPRVGFVDVVAARLERQRLLPVAVADEAKDRHQQQHTAQDEEAERQRWLCDGRCRRRQVQQISHLTRKTLDHLRKQI